MKFIYVASPLFWHGEGLQETDWEGLVAGRLGIWALFVYLGIPPASSIIIFPSIKTKWHGDFCSFALICHHKHFSFNKYVIPLCLLISTDYLHVRPFFPHLDYCSSNRQIFLPSKWYSSLIFQRHSCDLSFICWKKF